MSEFLVEQSDFILFLYGLAFILLAITCFAIARQGARQGAQRRSWLLFGAFGLVHGTGEWLDLSALVIHDSATFAAIRLAVMAVSFLLLMEFARHELARRYPATPGAWIYAPIALLTAFSAMTYGLNEAAAIARYTIGLPAALGASAVFAFCAAEFSGAKRGLAIAASVCLAAYAVAAGVIVTAASGWPADTLNTAAFRSATGIPIMLVRGALACLIASCIWGIWGQSLISEVASPRYARFLRRQFVVTLAALAIILGLGWALTEYFGIIHKRQLKLEAQSNLDLIAASLASETKPLDAISEALAATPTVRAAAVSGESDAQLNALLDISVSAAGAAEGHLLDRNGKIIASASRAPSSTPEARDLSSIARHTIEQDSRRKLAFDPQTRDTEYIAIFPVRAADAEVVGAAALKRTLSVFAERIGTLGIPFFLVDPQGIVALSNVADARGRPLWPLQPAQRSALSQRYQSPLGAPITAHFVTDASWRVERGEPVFARRVYFEQSDWSLVTFTPVESIFATRVLGIAITLLMAIMALIYIVARARSVHDHVQMDRRLELEELARNLDRKASTDPLTGLANRLKFDETLNREILRARRLAAPLSLILYDVDHFKDINDNYGHQAGDYVLTELSDFVRRRLRASDALARWGGEEFAILAAHTDGVKAARLAEMLREDMAVLPVGRIAPVSCSFGVAQLGPGEEADAFIARADKALYRAKMEGRDRVVLAASPQPDGDVGSAA